VRLFLDANVLFSMALGSGESPHPLLKLANFGQCTLFTSSLGAEEARRNMERKVPHASERLDAVLSTVSISPDPTGALVSWALHQGLPAKDAPLLAAAIAARSDLFVTGDLRHFGHLFGRVLRGVQVIRLSDAIGLIVEGAKRADSPRRGSPS
jgi:predicted nucleic acid-binding protein